VLVPVPFVKKRLVARTREAKKFVEVAFAVMRLVDVALSAKRLVVEAVVEKSEVDVASVNNPTDA
jgi:hypothetical protein